MRAAVVQSRDCNPAELVSRSPVAGFYEAELMLKRWLKVSEEVWLGLYDGEIACVYGLQEPSVVGGRAYLWLFTTDLVEEHKFVFIRHSQRVVEDALKRYPVIFGQVGTRNLAAKKWLEWLGAEIGQPTVDGYRPFVIRRHGHG